MFPPFGFWIKESFICYFYCTKWPLYVNFSIPFVEIDDFTQASTPCMGMRFCGHVLNSPKNKNLKKRILNLLKKWLFWTQKTVDPLLQGNKTFSSTPNVVISQVIRNESMRFDRHIDIEVRYKTLWLEIPKLVQILHYPACFQKGLFGDSFEQKHPWRFRG